MGHTEKSGLVSDASALSKGLAWIRMCDMKFVIAYMEVLMVPQIALLFRVHAEKNPICVHYEKHFQSWVDE